MKALNYIRGVIVNSNDVYSCTMGLGKKFRLLGISGMRGIGKTRLLYEIGEKVINNNINGLNKKVIPIYISFSGGSDNLSIVSGCLFKLGSNPNLLANCFGQMLLINCGIPKDYVYPLDFDQCLTIYRKISNAEDAVLVFLIDEIGHFGNDIAMKMISTLMSEMDVAHDGNNNNNLIFIFSHISQQFLKQQGTNSGRPVIALPLTSLDIDIWKYLPNKDPTLIEASNKFPALHQLFLSCSGHPRSIFEGINVAI
jgi:nucleoside-triphosphatase THEP1